MSTGLPPPPGLVASGLLASVSHPPPCSKGTRESWEGLRWPGGSRWWDVPWLWFPVGARQRASILSFTHSPGQEEAGVGVGDNLRDTGWMLGQGCVMGQLGGVMCLQSA